MAPREIDEIITELKKHPDYVHMELFTKRDFRTEVVNFFKTEEDETKFNDLFIERCVTEWIDEYKKVLGGHEITVIGSKRDAKGNLNFICNDTDDNYSGPVVISSKDLIPKIHHAGIPAKLVDIPKLPDIGYQILTDYKNYKQAEEPKTEQRLNLTA